MIFAPILSSPVATSILMLSINFSISSRLSSTNVNVGSDDGPGTFYQSFSDFYRVADDDIPNFMQQSGWSVVDYIIKDKNNKVLDPSLDFTMIYNPIGQVTFGRAGSITGDKKPIESPTVPSDTE